MYHDNIGRKIMYLKLVRKAFENNKANKFIIKSKTLSFSQ